MKEVGVSTVVSLSFASTVSSWLGRKQACESLFQLGQGLLPWERCWLFLWQLPGCQEEK